MVSFTSMSLLPSGLNCILLVTERSACIGDKARHILVPGDVAHQVVVAEIAERLMNAVVEITE